MADYERLFPDIEQAWEQIVKGDHLKDLDRANSCTTTNYAKGERKEYQQMRFKNHKYYVHIIAAMIHQGRAPAEGEEASHLCHNAACVTPNHIVFEDGETNKSRGCCKLFGRVPGFLCPHNPPCMGCVALIYK